MDVLTHLFLPLSVAFAVRPEWFDSPAWLALGAFGLFSDFDKFVGAPGLLHSLVGVVPMSLALLGLGRVLDHRGWVDDATTAGRLATGFVWSHLLLDVIDGGPVPLLAPVFRTGVGLEYPARVVFGAEPLGLAVQGPLVALRIVAPRAGFNAYGFINGFGIASVLAFAAMYLGWQSRAPDNESDSVSNEIEMQRNGVDGRDGGGDR